jgi:predicted O-methyltransferase YrrM
MASYDELPAPPVDTHFMMTQPNAAFLAGIVQAGGVERVLEFGSGYSTLVLASALAQRGGGSVTTVEQSPEWSRATLARAADVPGADVQQLPGALRMAATPAGFVRVYGGLDPALRDRGPYDLVVVDAPHWREGREGALHAALPHLRPDARIVLDDAGRTIEQWVLRRWLAACPNLRLELYEHHVPHHSIAVLRFAGPAKLVGSTRLVLDSLLLAALLAVARLLRPTPWPR